MGNWLFNKKKIILVASVALSLLMSFRDIGQLIDAFGVFSDTRLTIIIVQVFVSLISSFFLCWFLFNINVLWDRSTLYRLIYSVVLTAIFCVIGYFLIDLLSESVDFRSRDDAKEWYHVSIKESWIITKLIIISAICVVTSVIYTLSVNKIVAEKRYEILRAESLKSELKALNNQINPHFFFNALNSLHSLIIEDQKEKSLEYLVNLSVVFRYILKSDKKTLVKLSEELEFLDTYKYMLFVKYGEKLKFNIDVEHNFSDHRIPVLSLLPVIENVIKHNEVSNMFPMEILIRVESGILLIRNPKRERLDSIHSVGSGLENLNTRFKILLDKEIRIEETDDNFAVYLPLEKQR